MMRSNVFHISSAKCISAWPESTTWADNPERYYLSLSLPLEYMHRSVCTLTPINRIHSSHIDTHDQK